jgi:hypothetical protein
MHGGLRADGGNDNRKRAGVVKGGVAACGRTWAGTPMPRRGGAHATGGGLCYIGERQASSKAVAGRWG